jgi:rod shape-determining protein MreC
LGLEAVNQELARENAALRASLPSAKAPGVSTNDSNYEYVPARSLNISYTKRNNYMLLNVGTKDGIQTRDGCDYCSGGWIGTVWKLANPSASVIPLLHLKGNIGGRIQGKGLGELRWEGSDHRVADLFDIQREHEPRKEIPYIVLHVPALLHL